jgi:ADP-ribose pyrophosphatase
MTKPAAWQTITQTKLHQTPWITVLRDTCQLPGGQQIDYTYVNRVGGCSVIPVTSDHQLVLAQQYRHPIGQVVWQFPAEGIEPGESYADCAQRCLYEEAHYQAEKLTDLGLFYADPGTIQQDIHWFLAENVRPLPTEVARAQTDETEEFRIESFSLEQIKQMIKSGQICDNWTLAGLALLQLNQVIPEQK